MKIAEMAKRSANQNSLAEKVLLMHEMWAASGHNTVQAIKKRRLAAAASSHEPRADVSIEVFMYM